MPKNIFFKGINYILEKKEKEPIYKYKYKSLSFKTSGCSHTRHGDVINQNIPMFLFKTSGCFESISQGGST